MQHDTSSYAMNVRLCDRCPELRDRAVSGKSRNKVGGVGTVPDRRPKPDWKEIHAEYRAGLLSLREIAVAQGVSHTAIRKRAARDGWERDLLARIKVRAEALVSKTEVSSEVSTVSRASEAAIVETNAQAVMQIRLQHRRDIARARALATSLLDDLQAISANVPLVERLSIAVAQDAALGRKESDWRVAAVQKALSLPSRAGMMKTLADTMTKLIALEREAYDLDADPDRNESALSEQLAEMLRQIDGAGTGLPSHLAPHA